MTDRAKTLRRAAGTFALLVVLGAGWATPAGAGGNFPAAVEQILMNQTDGRISTLSVDQKRELIVCVNNVLADMPNGMKRFVLEAASYDDMEARFGKVVMENRAEWKQKIAQGCAHIVV